MTSSGAFFRSTLSCSSPPKTISAPAGRIAMNVCVIAYTFYEGDNRVMRYAEAPAPRGDHVDVLALGRKGRQKEEVFNGVRVFRLQSRKKNEKTKWSYLFRIVMFFIRVLVKVTLEACTASVRVGACPLGSGFSGICCDSSAFYQGPGSSSMFTISRRNSMGTSLVPLPVAHCSPLC